MAEPSSSAAGGLAAWKAFGGFAAFAAAGAGLAALVVMCMMTPRSPKEWAVGLVSTVLGSVCGGAAVVQHYSLQSWFTSYVGLVAILGLAFACGLPAWALVRWAFTWMIRRQDKDLGEVLADARKAGMP
jgi:hypothetical protein